MKSVSFNKKYGFYVLWVYEETLRMNFYFLPNVDHIGTAIFIKNKFGFDNEGTVSSGKCTEVLDKNNSTVGIIININSFKFIPEDIAILGHEVIHATVMVMQSRKVNLNFNVDSNTKIVDEHFTYYSEYLLREFLWLFKNIKKIKRK